MEEHFKDDGSLIFLFIFDAVVLSNPRRDNVVLSLVFFALNGAMESCELCGFASRQMNPSKRSQSSERKGLFGKLSVLFPRDFQIEVFRSFVDSSQIRTSQLVKGRRKNVEHLKSLILPGEPRRRDSIIYKLGLPPPSEWVDFRTGQKTYKFGYLDLSPSRISKGQSPEGDRACVRSKGKEDKSHDGMTRSGSW